MNNIKDKIWEFINEVIDDPAIPVIIGNQNNPRPKQLPYIVFFTTAVGNEAWDVFQYDEANEQMKQSILIETLADIRAVGANSDNLLLKIYAAAGNIEQQQQLNNRGVVIYNREAPRDHPYIETGEVIDGAAMSLWLREGKEYDYTLLGIEKIKTTAEMISDSGQTHIIENEI